MEYEVIRQDVALEAAADRCAEALAEHRWHWTMDETNPDRVPFREYARAVQRDPSSIRRLARASPPGRRGGAPPLSEYVERIEMSDEREAATEAVADAQGVAFTTVTSRSAGRREVAEVLTTARERAERRGTTVEAELPDVAQRRQRHREAAKTTRARKADQSSLRYIAVEGHLAQASSALRKALAEAAGVDWEDDGARCSWRPSAASGPCSGSWTRAWAARSTSTGMPSWPGSTTGRGGRDRALGSAGWTTSSTTWRPSRTG